MAESFGAGLANTMTTLNANFKELYAERLQKLLPENTRLIRDVNVRKGRLGKQFHMPVAIKQEHGFTYAAASAGAFAFNNVVPGKIVDATIDGVQLHGWCAIDYETAAKGANSKTAFVDSVGQIIESLHLSAQRRREIRAWYGRSGIARIVAGWSNAAAMVIDPAYWAPATWVGMEGAVLQVAATATTCQESTSLRAIGATGTISSIDIPNKTITLAAFANVVAQDYLLFNGEAVSASPLTWNEGVGLHEMIFATYTSGTAVKDYLHGLKPVDYSLWAPNKFNVGSTTLSVEAIQDCVAQAVAKGLEGKANLYINPATMSKLITDLGGLRRFAKDDGKKYTIGAADLQIECQGISVNIVSCPYVWEGYGYLLNPDVLSFIQAYPLSSKVPGRGDDLFYLEPGYAAYSMQIYSHEGLFIEAPCLVTGLYGIVNS